MADKPLRLLCIFSGLLGNRILSERLEEVISTMDDVKAQFIYITNKDYHQAKAPKWIRLSNTFETEWVTRKVFEQSDIKEFDAIFINGLEHSLPFARLIEKVPSVIGCDTTMNMAQQQMRQYVSSPLKRLKSRMIEGLLYPKFKKVFKHNDIFMPMSKWCEDSLVKLYDVKREDSYISYVPIDFSKWPAKENFNNERKEILFVGNDFHRKGGDLLLDIHQKHFKDTAHLRIISTDPYLAGKSYENVEILHGIDHEQIKAFFRMADLFVFPTRKEYLGVVVTEALATGTPVIARDTGALSEYVINGQTGVLMPYASEHDEWVKAIKDTLADDQVLKKYSQNGRKIAQELFCLEAFKKEIKEMIGRLKEKVESKS